MMLTVCGLVAGYAATPVLHDVSITVGQGEIVSLVGSNGAGKSTLVKSISGLMRPMAGSIQFEGRTITALDPAERLRLGIAHVPEGRQVFAAMTVAENLALGSTVAKGDQAARLAEVYGLFPVLRERMGDVVGNFSGGQQQMLAIARGLMSGPRLLLLDEPSLGLSPMLVAEVFRLIQGLRDRGISILLAEQNARSALRIADRGYVIENGRVTLSGSASDLLASPEIAERYLGGKPADGTPRPQAAGMARRLADCIAS